jgi:hypothetical protein
MAHLFYGGSRQPIELPDRVLAHLKVVIAMKLRRGEAFTVSWRSGAGRETLWMQPSIALRFVFSSATAELLDRAVLNDMSMQANASSGIMLTWDESGDPVPAAPDAGAHAPAHR